MNWELRHQSESLYLDLYPMSWLNPDRPYHSLNSLFHIVFLSPSIRPESGNFIFVFYSKQKAAFEDAYLLGAHAQIAQPIKS